MYRDGIPAGFIDWDGAQPVGSLVDLTDAAWAFGPLAPPGQLPEAGFDPCPAARRSGAEPVWGVASGRGHVAPAGSRWLRPP